MSELRARRCYNVGPKIFYLLSAGCLCANRRGLLAFLLLRGVVVSCVSGVSWRLIAGARGSLLFRWLCVLSPAPAALSQGCDYEGCQVVLCPSCALSRSPLATLQHEPGPSDFLALALLTCTLHVPCLMSTVAPDSFWAPFHQPCITPVRVVCFPWLSWCGYHRLPTSHLQAHLSAVALLGSAELLMPAQQVWPIHGPGKPVTFSPSASSMRSEPQPWGGGPCFKCILP